ncbi:MAG: LamG domain-containing protein [Spirochaetes bacterium]|nr:LamG domain-containing protein [Spirochaetota bacterium]
MIKRIIALCVLVCMIALTSCATSSSAAKKDEPKKEMKKEEAKKGETKKAAASTADSMIFKMTFNKSDLAEMVSKTQGVGVGNIQYTEGVKGMALLLDGEGSYVDFVMDPKLTDGMDECTIVCWMKPAETVDQQYGRADFVIGAEKARPHISYNIKYEGKLRGYGKGVVSSDNEIVFEKDKWYQLACSLKEGDYSLYINAELVGQNTEAGPGVNLKWHDGESKKGIAIGRDQQDSIYWKGAIDQVFIWRKAMTPEEIKAEYDKFAPK